MPKYLMTKSFRFEAAHRLDKFYKGKCRNLHGHSWNGELRLSYEGDLNQYDFAIDFGDMGTFTKWVEELFDHKTLVFAGDRKLIDYLKATEQEHVLFPDNPTCEVIAKFLYERAVSQFKELNHTPGIKDISITIKETCTTSCTYEKS